MPLFSFGKSFPVKKTYEEVFADLVKSLATKANGSLSNPFPLPDQPTLDNLQEIFQQITRNRFFETFQYNFDSNGVSPPKLAPGATVILVFEQFYKVEDENKNTIPPTQTTQSVGQSTSDGTDPDPPFEPIPDDRQPLSQILDEFKTQITGLPDWAQDKAQDYIVNRLEWFFTESGPFNDWVSDVNTPEYENPNNKYENSVRLDCVFIRLSGVLTETEVKAQLDTVYCLGIYYYVTSPATLARRSLWKELYVDASKLLVPPPTVPDNPSKDELEAILVQYRDDRLFQDDFGFPFNGDPDNLLEDRGRPTHLFVIADDDFSSLTAEIEKYIFSMVEFPEWAAASVKADLQASIENNLKSSSSSTAGWLRVKYDKSPTPPSKDYPAFHIKAELVYCTLISPNRSDVTFRALYFCGIFYTSRAAQDSVAQELLNAVYNAALRLVSDNITPPDQPTQDDLNALLSKALDEKFQAKFKFPYAGAQTKPSDQVGDVLYFAKGEYSTANPDDAAAEEATEKFMSQFNFPWDDNEAKLRQRIHDDLLLKVKQCFAETLTNTWDEKDTSNEYDYSDTDHNPLNGKYTILYCNGSVSAQGTIQKRSFVYLVGVFYEVEANPW